ncbi:MAG: class I SAM-dependent methyltransferase [Leptospirales bacterium]|nr:class I SAM-dependent methyltransferase [Leptospirales bacterium]
MNTNTLTKKTVLQTIDRRPRTLAETLFYKYLAKAKQGSLRLRFEGSDEEKILGQSGESGPVMIVKSDRFFWKALRYGEVGFGEAFVDGLWTTDDLTGVLSWFQANASSTPTFSANRSSPLVANLLGFVNRIRHAMRKNTRKNSVRNIAEHYDLSNEFFRLILDETMAYSSAVFTPSATLSQAQVHKFEMICKKLALRPGMNVLEIGCGWGGFAAYAAEQYGVSVEAVTISKQQFEFTRAMVEKRQLGDRIKVRLIDYRDLKGQYDRIVSIEMVEALGFQYMDAYFSKVNALLKHDGIFVMQAIFFPDPYYPRYLRSTDWTQKYVFPGSCLLSLHETMKSLHRTGDLIVWDVESLGPHYAETLRRWRNNLFAREGQIRALGMDDRFFRIWNYYFSFCEVGFQTRYINDMQIVMARPMNRNLESRKLSS